MVMASSNSSPGFRSSHWPHNNVFPNNYVVSSMLPKSHHPWYLDYYQRRWVEQALVWITGTEHGNLYKRTHVSSALLICGMPPSTHAVQSILELNAQRYPNRNFIDVDTVCGHTEECVKSMKLLKQLFLVIRTSLSWDSNR